MTTITTTAAEESVHLQLHNEEEDSSSNSNSANPTSSSQPITVHTYIVVADSPSSTTTKNTTTVYKSLNTSRNKFLAFLTYNNVTIDPTRVQSHTVNSADENTAILRMEWRKLWKQRQLLTDRTELLAVYPSDGRTTTKKRGGFEDLLHLYTERMAAILQDEESSSFSLLHWLQDHYGVERTQDLLVENLQEQTETEQLARFKTFLEWFRERFPYYYDRCGHCGASLKDDLAQLKRHEEEEEEDSEDEDEDGAVNGDGRAELALADGGEKTDDQDHDDDEEYQTFIGYIYPSESELDGKASRTELYRCHKCREFTRFPRFNSAQHVIGHGRGRCGEYSMLLFLFLRALNHECRWVVDWADHVWAEALIGDKGKQRWVHLDPCEASVDENLLYEGWGKKQTYILAFYAPKTKTDLAPLIEDVTHTYTSDALDVIRKRRDDDNIQLTIEKAIVNLEERLLASVNGRDDRQRG